MGASPEQKEAVLSEKLWPSVEALGTSAEDYRRNLQAAGVDDVSDYLTLKNPWLKEWGFTVEVKYSIGGLYFVDDSDGAVYHCDYRLSDSAEEAYYIGEED